MTPPSGLLVQLQSPDFSWIDVGILYNVNERNWFEFRQSYWNASNRPVLGQIFEEEGRAWRPSAHVALPNWFSHLLPEGWLRDAVAAAAHTHRSREFNLLARIGYDDLPGALRVRPVDGVADVLTPPEVLQAGQAHGDSDPLLKFSLAGTQLKYSVYRDQKGLTIPVRGRAGNAIAKLPDGRPAMSGIPNAELACLELARSAGITTPDARLVDVQVIAGLEDWAGSVMSPVLVVDRFDRAPFDRRIHMEEIAQVLNTPARNETAKYRRANFETIATLIGALCGIGAVGEVIDRIVLNVLVGNGDAHLKNWAILYPNGITPVLAPVYDVLPTVLYIDGDDLGLKLNGSRDFALVEASSFDPIGRRTGFGEEQARMRALDAADRILAQWDRLRDHLSHDGYDRLTRRLSDLPLTRIR